MNLAKNFADNASGIQHLGIPTADLPKTIAFYEGIGFQILWEKPGEVAFLKLGTLVVETYPCDAPAMKNGAIDHIAINVRDIDQAWADAMAAGYETEDKAVNFLLFFENGVKYFTIIGPNREKIEFNQLL